MLRETLARLADTGVSVLDTEFLRFEPDRPVGIPEGFLEVSARLGPLCQNVLVMSAEPEGSRTPQEPDASDAEALVVRCTTPGLVFILSRERIYISVATRAAPRRAGPAPRAGPASLSSRGYLMGISQ